MGRAATDNRTFSESKRFPGCQVVVTSLRPNWWHDHACARPRQVWDLDDPTPVFGRLERVPSRALISTKFEHGNWKHCVRCAAS